MSKIFEVLQQNGAIGFEGMALEGIAEPVPAPSTQTAAAPEPQPFPERLVSLRVSALSPIFPFSEDLHHAAAEQYRIVRTKILHSEKKPRFVLVSSACPGDGKTTTAIN
ncbi:MAG: hypothetical protein ACRD06_07035, partial [Terriglobia bacterium]